MTRLMSILLFIVGGITLMLGALALGYGSTINEFSFGNTLIVAGTVAAVGGLIVVGLGAVVSHLQRLVDTVAMRAPLRPNRPLETAEAGRPPTAGRPSPPLRAAGITETGEAPPVEPSPAGTGPVAGEPFAAAPAPTLPNPDVPPVAALPQAGEEPPAAPPPPFRAPPPAAEPPEVAPPPSANGLGGGAQAFEPEPEPESEPLPAWLSPPRAPEPPPPEPPQPLGPGNFEAVWPPVKGRAGDQPNARDTVEETAEETQAAPTALEPAGQAAAPEPPAERRNVAILKSGVVDGMAYTLYVDGSIEAELPQGTLRFASINDLREHLERTS